MSFEFHFEDPKIYQVHDRVYLEQEFKVKPPTWGDLLSTTPKISLGLVKYLLTKKLKVKLPTCADSLLIDGAELEKIEVYPTDFAGKMEKKYLVLSGGRLVKEVNVIKLVMQFVLPSDKFYNFLDAQVLEKTKKGNGYAFTFLVKNKKDWPIEYVKMYLQILTEEVLNKTDLFRVNLEKHEKHRLLSEASATTITHIDRFERLDSKTYLLEIEFRNRLDSDTQIDVYINDSSLTKAESIVFVPGSMLESLKKFYDLLGTLGNDIWWFEEHLDKDCFHLLRKGIDKTRITDIHIIGGPIHMNKQFKEFYEAFKTDMSAYNINVKAKAILDERTLGLLHGRFLFDQNRLYTIPPSNVVSKKFDAIVLVSNVNDSQKIRAQIRQIWRNSTKISNWKKIKEKRKSLIPKASL